MTEIEPNLIVTQQNILAKSLGSNTIPWCLNLSSDLHAQSDAALASYYSKHKDKSSDDENVTASQSSVHSHSCKSWKEWKDKVLTPQYLKSFHKNFDSGNHAEMRSFWGKRECKSADDIPSSLPNIRFESEDCISYETEVFVRLLGSDLDSGDGTNDNSKANFHEDENDVVGDDLGCGRVDVRETDTQYRKRIKKRVFALTLRGVLFAEPAFQSQSLSTSKPPNNPSSLAHALFQNIVSVEENVFDWCVRGPRLFQSLLYPSLPMFASTTTKDLESNITPIPDIIALQEYDVHSVKAKYRSRSQYSPNDDELMLTFSEAMRKEGYSGAFFSDPLLNKTPPSGLAIYFKHDKFEICDAFEAPISVDESRINNVPLEKIKGVQVEITRVEAERKTEVPWTLALACGQTAGGRDSDGISIGPAAINFDLMEHWTPVPKTKTSKQSQGSTHTDNEVKTNSDGTVGELKLMKSADRRDAGFLRLKERHPPHRVIHVINVHLMTTSRDCSKTNMYPGEVRAGELEVLKGLVRHHVGCSASTSKDKLSAKPTVILVGDFNTTPDELHVFDGKLKLHTTTKTATKTNNDNKTEAKEQNIKSISTGFCTDDRSFEWIDAHGNNVKLHDAFSSVHSGQNKDKHCTSRNANRSSWIDYIYHTDSLDVIKNGLSDTHTPTTAIPNENYGSDHLPLTVGFHWRNDK